MSILEGVILNLETLHFYYGFKKRFHSLSRKRLIGRFLEKE